MTSVRDDFSDDGTGPETVAFELGPDSHVVGKVVDEHQVPNSDTSTRSAGLTPSSRSTSTWSPSSWGAPSWGVSYSSSNWLRAPYWMQYLVSNVWNRPAARTYMMSYIAYASLYSARKPFSVVKIQLQQQNNISTYWLGAIDTCFLAAYAFGQILIPGILARYNITLATSMYVCFLGSGLTSVLFGLASAAPVYALLWSANGLLHAPVFPCLIGTISPHYPPEDRGRVMSSWTTSQQIGSALATALASWVSNWLGFRAAFVVPGVLVAAVGYLLVQTLFAGAGTQPPQRSDLESGGGKLTPANKQEGEHHTLWSVSKIRDIKLVAAAYCFVKCVRYALLFWLPFYLAKTVGYAADRAGYASMLFDVGGVIGGFLSGWMADRLMSGRRMLLAAILSACAGFSLIAFPMCSKMGSWGVLLMIGLLGITVAGPDSLLGGAGPQDLIERSHLPLAALPLAAGIVNGLGSCGAVLQGQVTAYVSSNYGWDAVYQMLGLFIFVSGFLLIVPLLHEHRSIIAAKNDFGAV